MRRLPNWLPIAAAACLLGGAPGLAAPVSAQARSQAQPQPLTLRASVSSAGAQAQVGGIWGALSADGRFVAFLSHSEDLVPDDTNFERDFFVHDRLTGVTERVSVDDAGLEQDLGGFQFGLPGISGDGRFVVFDSPASNLVPGVTSGFSSVFVRDRLTGTTSCVSLSSAGEPADGDAGDPRLSVDGRCVAFTSLASNLAPADADGVFATDVFLHDRGTGLTEHISVAFDGAPAGFDAVLNGLSDDGRWVTFHSVSAAFVPGDTNGFTDVFLRDRQRGLTEIVSLTAAGDLAAGTSAGSAVSADGRFVAFTSEAVDLVAGDGNGTADVFLRDRRAGTTTRVSVAADGSEAHGSSQVFALSSDGRFVFFVSFAPDLLPGDDNGERDLFRKDTLSGAIERVNVASDGTPVAVGAMTVGSHCTPDGQAVGFMSKDPGLVPADTNGTFDSFVRDLGGPWENAGCALAGLQGDPIFYATGTLVAGEPLALRLVNARPASLAVLCISFGLSSGVPFKGGCLKAVPVAAQIGRITDGLGQVVLPALAPPLPSGMVIGLQWVLPDAAAVRGVALSNALAVTTP